MSLEAVTGRDGHHQHRDEVQPGDAHAPLHGDCKGAVRKSVQCKYSFSSGWGMSWAGGRETVCRQDTPVSGCDYRRPRRKIGVTFPTHPIFRHRLPHHRVDTGCSSECERSCFSPCHSSPAQCLGVRYPRCGTSPEGSPRGGVQATPRMSWVGSLLGAGPRVGRRLRPPFGSSVRKQRRCAACPCRFAW